MRPAGGAAVRRAASGKGTEAPAGVQRRGLQAAASCPQTGEEETPTLQEKTPPSQRSTLIQDAMEWTSWSACEMIGCILRDFIRIDFKCFVFFVRRVEQHAVLEAAAKIRECNEDTQNKHNIIWGCFLVFN